MPEVLSPDEVSALQSFRVGDSGPLKLLPAANFQRVLRRMTWGELLLLGPVPRRDCPHDSTVVDGLVRRRVQVTRCLDCGLISLDEVPVSQSA